MVYIITYTAWYGIFLTIHFYLSAQHAINYLIVIIEYPNSQQGNIMVMSMKLK